MATMQQTDPHTGAPIGEPVELGDTTHKMGDVVRLADYVGSKAKQKIIYRIVRLPDPKATRAVLRDTYGAEPITGGQGVNAEGWMLNPGSAADKATAARTVAAPTPSLGWVVETSARLRGMQRGERLVVTGIRDTTVSLTVLDSDGRTWNRVPVATLKRVSL